MPQASCSITTPGQAPEASDDSLGPAGMDEWMAFLKDSEGNTIGLISHHKPETSSNDQNLWMSSGQGAPSREMIFEGFQF
jgi:hypothetical protein